MSDKINPKVLGKPKNLISEPVNEKNTCDSGELKLLRNGKPYRVIIGHTNKNLIRNKFELLAKHVGNHLVILKVSETKRRRYFNRVTIFNRGFFNT